MKLIFLIIVSWFSPLIVVGENTYNGGRVIANTNNGKKFICEGKLINGKHEGNCFVAGTLVATQKGYQPIEQIKPGSIVSSYNEMYNKSTTSNVQEVTSRKVNKLIRVVTTVNDTVLVTEEHPFMTKGTHWVFAKNLNHKTKLLSLSGALVGILSISIVDTVAMVYNFKVANTHTYTITKNKYIVHNNCGEVFEAAYNKLVKHPNFSGANGLEAKMTLIDKTIINTGANDLMANGFRLMKEAELAMTLENPKLLPYLQAPVNAAKSYLKDYEAIKAFITPEADILQISTFSKMLVEARTYMPTAGFLADYDISKLTANELWDLSKYVTDGFANTPAAKTAEMNLLYFGKKQGGIYKFGNFDTRRQKLTNFTTLAEFDNIRKKLTLEQVDEFDAATIKYFISETATGNTELLTFINKTKADKLTEITNIWNTKYPIEEMLGGRTFFERMMGHYRYNRVDGWFHTGDIAQNFKGVDFYKGTTFVNNSTIFANKAISVKTTIQTDVNLWLNSDPIKDNIRFLKEGLDISKGLLSNGKKIVITNAEIHIYMKKENITDALKITWMNKLNTVDPKIKFEVKAIEDYIK